MKEAILEDAYKFVVKDTPKPKPGPGAVLVKVRYCSICGSDVLIYKLGPKDSRLALADQVFGFPTQFLLGHEFCGDIAETGEGVWQFKVGDRVVVRGVGAYAEYVVSAVRQMERSVVYRLPDEVTYKEAALIEPLSVAVDAVRRSQLRLGDVAVVLGAGSVGLFTLQCAKAAGARRVYITEVSEFRLKKAKEFGADEIINAKEVDPVQRIDELTDGLGPDVVFECAGKPETTWQMLVMLPRQGKGVIVASYEKPFEVDPNIIMLKNLDVAGILSGVPESWDPRWDPFKIAMDLIKAGRVKVDPLITATVPLEDINEAFMALSKGEQLAVLVKP